MDTSLSIISNFDIELTKRDIKRDSWLFLVLYFIPVILSFLTGSPKAALTLIFIFSIFCSPYWLTAILGFLASSNERSYANCYSTFLKFTFIYVLIGVGVSLFSFVWLFKKIAAHKGQSNYELVAALLLFMLFLCLVYTGSAFTLWIFANKHANRLKDLMVKELNMGQNPNMTGRVETNSQLYPPVEIEVGRYPQQYPQSYSNKNYPQNYPYNPVSYDTIQIN